MVDDVDTELARALAEDLRDAGFMSAALREAWGVLADDALAAGLRAPAVAALGDRDDPLATLARLLALGVPEPLADVDEALPRTTGAGLARLGLVELTGDRAVPVAMVRPQAFADERGEGEWWIASDLDEAALDTANRGGALPTAHVLGVGGASLTLAGLHLPASVDRVLDLGTGCGIQALRARRYAREVTATDISARALRFTALNAALNGVDGIEVREGSLFAPIAGERFDRIVSNPPFVITPRAAGVPAYEYRDGGMPGDRLVQTVITGVGAHLNPGGTAQLLGNWEYRGDASGLDRVRGWVDASEVALDAWVIEREVLDPLAYAQLWVRDGGTAPGTPEYARLISAWLDDFAARGVTGIGFGYVLLRRPATGTATLARYEKVVQPVAPGLGAHLGEALAAHDRLGALDDAGLAASVLVVAPDVTEARHHVPGEEGPRVIELRQGGGLARVTEADPALAAVVGACDGQLPVGALAGAVAEIFEVDAEALWTELAPRVRELLFTGVLRFA